MVTEEPVRGTIPPPWFWAMPGIERMRAFSHGLLPLPPMSRLLGIRPAHVGPGSGTSTMPSSGWLQGPTGLLEISALVESAATGAAMSTVPAGADVEPVTLTVTHFRPTRTQPGTMLARARVVNANRFLTFAEVEIEDSQGRQIAHGSSHARIRRIEPTPPMPPAQLRPVEEAVYATADPITRSVTAEAPPVDLWGTTPGLDIMRGFSLETMRIPYQQLVGFRVQAIDRGMFAFTVAASEWFCRFSRSVAPGVLASLASAAAQSSMMTLVEPGEWFINVEYAIQFFRPVAADGRSLRVEARTSRGDGGRTRASILVYDADGTVVAASEHNVGEIIPAAERQKQSGPEVKRVLATLVFTDIVGSTAHAERLGDVRWRALLEEHRALVRAEIAAWDGVEVQTTGDGFLARFDSPARALECARAVRDGVRRLGIEIRVGIHTGECEIRGRDVTGMAVHVAARVEGAASGGEVLVSGIVKDLVGGSGMAFEDRGTHGLKGVQGEWRLYALAR
jgi:uncharacterized protein (TIGR00369 family)